MTVTFISSKRLEKWASSKLKKYDSDETFREARNKKMKTVYPDEADGRVAYKKFLDGEVEKSVSKAKEYLK